MYWNLFGSSTAKTGKERRNWGVRLRQNLDQQQYMFALGVNPTTAVKLFDSIAPSRIRRGQFLRAKAVSMNGTVM